MIEKLPYLKLSNGELLKTGEVKNTIMGELTIQKFNHGYDLASRTSLINHLISKYNFKNYLEIGVRDGRNFEKILIKNKVGVDPNPTKDIINLQKISSDDFFKINKDFFDIIFIDGLHLESQVDRDIEGSLKFLSDKGFIIMHDCNPPTEFHQRDNYEVNGKFPTWNGTVWKSFAKLRMAELNLEISCVNCDWGVGIIKHGKSKPFKSTQSLDFKFLDNNRVELLNLISVENFIKKY